MPIRSILPVGRSVYDLELLTLLRGLRVSRQLKVLCVIGAHRFDELALISRVFPSLRHIYLFEPQPGPLAALQRLAETDRRIRVFPFAISDTDGEATFNIASNDGESSSLLKLGTHTTLFPHVRMQSTLKVQTRRLDTVLTEHHLAPPDVMIIDVQGAEHMVLSAMSSATLERVRLIYTEVSTEAVYESAGLLSDVEALLSSHFVNVGFAAINAEVPMHGNAVFVAHSDVQRGLDWSLHERLRRRFHRLKRRLRGREPSGQGAAP